MLLIIELLFIVVLSLILFIIYRHESLLSKHALPQAKVEECWSGKERRQHVRFKKELTVNYAVEKKPHLKNDAKTVDISEGGMKLIMDDKLAKGTILDLKIALQDSRKIAEVEGEVVWNAEMEGTDPSGKRFFYAGIKFIAIKGPAENTLADYIRSLATSIDISTETQYQS